MKYTLSATLAVLVLLTVVQLPTRAQENDYLIVPGQRVGPWELGNNLETYRFGQPFSRWVQAEGNQVWADGFNFSIGQPPLILWVFTCRNDNLVFAVMPGRFLNQLGEAESAKYKTKDGVGIGTDESEALRLLGKPSTSFDSSERHGSMQVLVRVHDFPGLRVRVNKADNKVYLLGATSAGGFGGCRSAILGGPTTVAQQPAPAITPAPAGVPVTVQLPVPIPANLRIVPPSPEIPTDRAAFSGVWAGRWGNVLDTALAVQEITASGVSAVYSWGVAPQWEIRQSGWSQIQGTFVGSVLQFRGCGGTILYRMRPDGRLDAECQRQETVRAILTKVFPK